MSFIWISCIIIGACYWFLYVLGYVIEKKIPETSDLKKFWRKHILAPDPNEPEDGETRY